MAEALRQPFTFSQSSLQDYADCPRRFQLRYIDQLAWPAVDSEPMVENERRQQEGQLFHRLVQQHRLGLPADDLARLANTPDLARWWGNYTASGPALDGYTTFSESTLSAPLVAHRLVAKYDLIALDSNKAIIVDWKTYARRPRDEWMAARWQTRVYRALLALAGSHLMPSRTPIHPEQIEMMYWYADFPGEPASFKYSAAQFKRDWSAIEKVAKEISSIKEFPMTEDEKMCRFCIFRSYCDRGRQAGAMDEAEAGTQAEAAFDVNFEQVGEIEF